MKTYIIGWTTRALPLEPPEETLDDVLNEKTPYLVIIPERQGAQREEVKYIIQGVFI